MIADLERSNMRIQSLQKHIDTLQRFNAPHAASQQLAVSQSRSNVSQQMSQLDAQAADELRRAQETIEKLRSENE